MQGKPFFCCATVVILELDFFIYALLFLAQSESTSNLGLTRQ
jgi:hypothetical protein